MAASNEADICYLMEITLNEEEIKCENNHFSECEYNIRQLVQRNHLEYVRADNKIFIYGYENDFAEFCSCLSLLVQSRRLRPFYTEFTFTDYTEDEFAEPMDANECLSEWLEGLSKADYDENDIRTMNYEYRSERDMKRRSNKVYLIAALCTALLCSSCGDYDSKAEDTSATDTLTTVITANVDIPEADELDSSIVIELDGKEKNTAAADRKSESAGDLTEINEIETDDRKSETEEAGKETDATTETDATGTEAITEEDKEKTTTTTASKKATTTTRKVETTAAKTTTTTAKKTTTATTTTAKKTTTTTTTTKKTTTTTTAPASNVEWSRLMLAYKHYAESIFDVIDSMDYYDKSIFTNEDVELVRKDICDYLYNTYNGKQIVTVQTASGMKTLDFLRPLELTIDTSLRCWQEGTWVLGDAHLNEVTGIDWISRKSYNAMTEEQKYEYITKRRSECLESATNCLYRWYDYAGNELQYAYQLTFNYGIDNSGEFWFLNR